MQTAALFFPPLGLLRGKLSGLRISNRQATLALRGIVPAETSSVDRLSRMLFLSDYLSTLRNSIGGYLQSLSVSQPCNLLTVASSNLPPWASRILERTSSLIKCPPQPDTIPEKLLYLLTEYSTASYTTVAALLLSVIFLLYRYSMGDRRSFAYYDGRGSPFLSNLADSAPRNLSGHFEYIGADDDIYRQHRRTAEPDEIDDQDPNAPDRIHVRCMATAFIVDFPAYSINEEKTIVEDLRRKVANYLRVDPRLVRLMYKSRELKLNRVPLKKYRMKQNSEVTALVLDRPIDYYGNDPQSDSGSDSGSARDRNGNARRQPQRPRAHSSVRYRSDEQVPLARGSANGYLAPNGHIPPTSERRHRESSLRQSDRPEYRPTEHRESLRPSDRPERHESLRPSDRPERHESLRPDMDSRGRERAPSRSRATSRGASRSRGVSPGPPPTSSLPRADPGTPLGKMQALASTFHTQWLPQTTRFIISPPSDLAVRQKEHLKLSEMIMAQIVLKADDIDVEGNSDARAVRKTMIAEANSVMKQLDAVMKR